MFPASYGDCFLVRCHDKEKTNILIDAGLKSTYQGFLKKRLRELADEGETLSLFVCTHIDNDHISGALDFLEENGQADHPHIIRIDDIWHNSYRHLQFEKKGRGNLDKTDQEILRALRVRGIPQEVRTDLIDVRNPIGAKEGSTLAASILKGGYSWNAVFQGQAVSTEKPVKVQLNDEVSLTLLLPNREKLRELEKYWRKELYKLGFRGELTDNRIFDDAFEFLLLQTEDQPGIDIRKPVSSSQINLDKLLKTDDIETLLPDFSEDSSPKNGSSISFILECGGKRMLFLGDAHPSLIETQLREFFPGKSSLYFDVVKLSHHGSKNNTLPAYLSAIDAEKYLVSTNGELYDHPDIETLLRIVSRETERERKLIFNHSKYPIKLTTFLNHPNLKERFKYEAIIPEKAGVVMINL